MPEIKGIDVSKWQGTITWPKVKADGVKFAMIRAGIGGSRGGGSTDPCFEKNIGGALGAGLDVGAYLYSYALTAEAAKKEAEWLVSLLAPWHDRITYPVCYDLEDKSQAGLGRKVCTDMAIAFCDVIKRAGYKPMIYSNPAWLNNRLDLTRLGGIDIWLAQWAQKPTWQGKYTMWQKCEDGVCGGIKGNVDIDVSYVDYGEKVIDYAGEVCKALHFEQNTRDYIDAYTWGIEVWKRIYEALNK